MANLFSARGAFWAKLPLASIASFEPTADYFRCSPINGHSQGQSACLKRANTGSHDLA
jgi:hypothetical protein